MILFFIPSQALARRILTYVVVLIYGGKKGGVGFLNRILMDYGRALFESRALILGF